MTHSSHDNALSPPYRGSASSLWRRAATMKSSLAKVPIRSPVDRWCCTCWTLPAAWPEQGVAVVVGHRGPILRKVVEAVGGQVAVAEQAKQLGTGHAVLQARPVFGDAHRKPTRYLILNGDTPLLTEQTVRELLAMHDAPGRCGP